MKKIKLLMGSIIMTALLASCSDTQAFPSEDDIKPGQVSFSSDGETVVLEPVNAKLPSSFMRGFDASGESDSGRGSYYDATGKEKDIFSILPEFGVNWVRLRIWNNPHSESNPEVPGDSDLDVVLDQALRAKNAGLKFLLDFHYSDFWSDPGKQVIPSDWSEITTSDGLAAKVSEYTEEVLEALVEQGTVPDMIQIGNEISSGILKHSGISKVNETEKVTDASSDIAGTFKSDNFYKYLAAGIKSARDVCPSSKIMLHFTNIKQTAPSGYMSDVKTKLAALNVDFDVVGLSYYPRWSSHGTLTEFASAIDYIKNTCGKEVVIVETNAPNRISDTASENYYDTSYVTNLTVDGKLYSGITADSDGKVPANYQNQAAIIRAVIEVAAQKGAIGVFAWGGEYKASWEFGLFTASGKPAASLIALNVQ